MELVNGEKLRCGCLFRFEKSLANLLQGGCTHEISQLMCGDPKFMGSELRLRGMLGTWNFEEPRNGLKKCMLRSGVDSIIFYPSLCRSDGLTKETQEHQGGVDTIDKAEFDRETLKLRSLRYMHKIKKTHAAKRSMT